MSHNLDSHNPDFEQVWASAAERGYEVRQLTKGFFTVRELLRGWSKLTVRIMPWRIGKLYAFGTLEEIDAWLDRWPM
jgi:hypothetical protein